MPVYKWSQTSASNATADSTINWAEGQAPSSVNDSARAMMAATAKYRDDISGAIVTSGTSTAYTVSSNQVFDTLAHLSGQVIAFTPHATNDATVTLNVDSLGAKPLRTAPSVELLAGTLVLGTPYVAVYNATDSVFYLQGFFGNNPYNVPIACGLDYWGSTSPNSSFVFAYGQAISRTTYATCFSRLGTAHGSGDGSTTFNLPDKRGRVSAGRDDMGGTAASRLTGAYFGATATSLGATGGSESHALSTPEGPQHDHGGLTGDTAPSITATVSGGIKGGATTGSFTSGGFDAPLTPANIVVTIGNTNHHHTIPVSGSSSAHNNVQPTIICNHIIRVI